MNKVPFDQDAEESSGDWAAREVSELRKRVAELEARTPIRERIGRELFKFLKDHERVGNVYLQVENSGPLGGKSTQIELHYIDEHDFVHRVKINVYCDERTNHDNPLYQKDKPLGVLMFGGPVLAGLRDTIDEHQKRTRKDNNA